jgi:hypothetical protein
MYSHDLRASKDGLEYLIPCEDSPMSDGLIAMWPYELKLGEATHLDLLEGLLEWASTSGIKYRIYKTRDEYETNEIHL